jgi:hypothetical protein
MRAFIRGLDIPLEVPAYVLNGAHGHRANDLHIQNSSTTRLANACVSKGVYVAAQMPRALTRDPQCAILSPKTTPPPCLPRVFTHRALTLLRTAETSKLKGRELNAPCPEAPRSACYTSTPSRARLGACSVDCVTGLENSRFSGQPAAEATLIVFCNNSGSFYSVHFRTLGILLGTSFHGKHGGIE